MQKIIHTANSRGQADHGWLHSFHTFSFADYQDRERMGFGKLRVLNDDTVQPGGGFGTHPHDNMEIVSIPLSGSLKHQDSMGNVHVIRSGEVQVMSAGTGITHSEYNGSDEDPVNFLQIWILPEIMNVTPRYEQRVFPPENRRNVFQTVISPDGRDGSLTLNQQAFFSLLDLQQDHDMQYKLHDPANGAYLFVLEGRIEIIGEQLGPRDAIALSGADTIDMRSTENAELLCIEVPLN